MEGKNAVPAETEAINRASPRCLVDGGGLRINWDSCPSDSEIYAFSSSSLRLPARVSTIRPVADSAVANTHIPL